MTKKKSKNKDKDKDKDKDKNQPPTNTSAASNSGLATEAQVEKLPPLSTSTTDGGSTEDEFTQQYMRQIVREFGDDIDAVRLSADFLANSKGALEILVDGLRMGVERVPRELRKVNSREE